MKASLGGNLNFADFTGADMTDTNLNNTNLYGAKGINFKQVKSVCNAIMPDGSEGKCSKDWKDSL